MARFGSAEVMALLVEGGAAAVTGAVQRLAWEQGNTNMVGWATTGVAFVGGAIGSAYTSGQVSSALKATSHGAAAIAGFLATDKLFLNNAKRVPRAQIEQVRAMSLGRGARDSVGAIGSQGQRKLLFSVTR